VLGGPELAQKRQLNLASARTARRFEQQTS